MVTPEADFIGWIRHVSENEDPESALRVLKQSRGNVEVQESAVRHLQRSLEALSANEELVFDAIIAIAAVAELRAKTARAILERLCLSARRRLLEDGTLPFVEEHFSLAALRALEQPTGRFSLVTVYEEYEKLIARVTDDQLGDEKRSSLLKKTSVRYRRAFEHVLFDGRDAQALESGQSSVSEETSSTMPRSEALSQTHPSDLPTVEDLAYRFKPLAQSFPTSAKPWQPQGAAITDRASSDMIRIDDFGPTGDELFLAHDVDVSERPKWVKTLLVVLSAIGGFGALVVVMLGLVHLPLLVASGCILGLGSLCIQGDQKGHWVVGWLGFVCAGLSLLATPTLAERLPQAMSPVLFLVSGIICLLLAVALFHPSVRVGFGQSAVSDDEF